MAEPRTGSASASSADGAATESGGAAPRRREDAFAPARHVSRPRRWRRRLLITLGAIVLLVVALPIGRYGLRAGWEEAMILAARRSIVDVIDDPATDATSREKLRLVLAARAFAADSIGLRTGESFTSYTRLSRDTLVLLVQAAHRDRLERHTWWFPVVGRVPYKGYFDFAAARREGERLQRDGLDVYLRPASAFSTLGIFDDPLLSTTLRADSLELANTVIHEVTHNTIYLRGQAVFNESFANFVGARGAAWLFRVRASPAAARETDDRWSDSRVLAAFWARLYQTVDSAYKAHPADRQSRLAARDSISARARIELVETLGTQLRTVGPRTLERMRLDNAALLSRRVYATDLDLFDRALEREGGDLRRMIGRVRGLVKVSPKDPYGAVRRWLESPREAAAQERAEIQ